MRGGGASGALRGTDIRISHCLRGAALRSAAKPRRLTCAPASNSYTLVAEHATATYPRRRRVRAQYGYAAVSGMAGDASNHEPGTDLIRVVGREAAEELGPFIGTMFGSPSFQLGELIGERIQRWRFTQAVNTVKKAKQKVEDAGLEPHEVPLRTLIPMLDAASLEDDGELVDRWSSLLANATSDPQSVPPSFPNILRELEPGQAQLLHWIYTQLMTLAPAVRRTKGILRERILELYEPSEGESPDDVDREVMADLDNLVRLRLLRGAGRNVDDLAQVTLTAFGERFVRACQPPGAPAVPITVHSEEEFQALKQAQSSPNERSVPKPHGDSPSL